MNDSPAPPRTPQTRAEQAGDDPAREPNDPALTAAPTRADAGPGTAPAVDPADAAVDPLGLDGPVEVDHTVTLSKRVKTVLIGKPRDLADHSIFHSLSLVAFLAWVGLGADGLSSSCYGPSEAFNALQNTGQGDFRFLAIFLALASGLTVFIISACYSHIIEEFPSGGGGYLVASKLLGKYVGVISGCALLVDYALTITVSVAAAGDSLFGLIREGGPLEVFNSPGIHGSKLLVEMFVIILLIMLNLRGIKESVMVLLPIFMIFLITHAILIAGALSLKFSAVGSVVAHVSSGINDNLANPEVGLLGMLLIFLRAYSMGAGTYTGIEAVSNSMPVMREPRVATGKRTMLYMATSLAVTAGGLMIAYLLLNLSWTEEPTMNHRLCESFVEAIGLPNWLGTSFVLVTVMSEGCLLFVAAQAGFIDGPRVLANMARDSWMPHWFASLSERLATHNGVLLMGFAGLAALWSTSGNVTALVIMYSINVFVTFSLSMIGMCRHWWVVRHENRIWKRRFAFFTVGAAMCLAILAVTIYEKFDEGGYKTIVVTLSCFVCCVLIHIYYRRVSEKLQRLNSLLEVVTPHGEPVAADPDPKQPTAAVLVGGYSGLGVHTLLNALRFGPGKFSNVVFLSVGVVDSGNFKGADAMDDLKHHTEEALNKYVDYTRRLGMPAVGFMSIGTDPVAELETLCVAVKQRFPRSIFFAGQLVFQKDTWYRRLLHNETAFSLQRRLQWDGVPMVILPTRVR